MPNISIGESFLGHFSVFPLTSPRISSKFGKRVHPVHHYTSHHSGIDLAAPKNSHVRAVANGKIIFADTYAGYGKLVTIEHKDGLVSLYGHLEEIRINIGDSVMAGQIIGRVGSSGVATGPHLHFELRKEGKPINPLSVFPELTAEAKG